MNIQGTAIPTQPAPATIRQRAVDVARQFESIFIKQMVRGMRENAKVLGSSMFGSGPGSDTYAQWFDDHMSAHLSGTGDIGIADTIVRELERLGQIKPAPGGER